MPAKAGTQATLCLSIIELTTGDAIMLLIPCVYILASSLNGTLYIGVTGDLLGRISIHKQDLVDGFTKRYGVHRLVYYETHETFKAAIRREKQLKKWRRLWKIRLIEQMNPQWDDLLDDLWGVVESGRGGQVSRNS